MKKIKNPSAHIQGYINHQFGPGSTVDSKLDERTLLVRTPHGNFQRVTLQQVHAYAMGEAERQSQAEMDQLRQEAKQRVQAERQAKVDAHNARPEVVAARAAKEAKAQALEKAQQARDKQLNAKVDEMMERAK